MRVLCLLFPRLAVQLALRHRPELKGRTLVFLQGHGEDALVAAATCDASARGLLVGMTAAEARHRVPRARFLPDNAGDCLDELERLADIIRRRATPLVEIAGREHLFIDITGLVSSGQAEAAVAAALARIATSFTGCTARTGVASTRAEALEAARASRVSVGLVPASGANEPPIAPHRREAIAAEATADSELRLRARLSRALRHLDVVLDSRDASFREAKLLLSGPDGEHEISFRLRTPASTTAPLAAAIEEAPAMLAGATGARIELSRLGPCVQIRPCVASLAYRPRTLPRQPARALLRAS